MPLRSRSRRSRSSEEPAAVAVDRPQLVESGVEAVGDDAAVADLGRRLVGDRASEQRLPSGVRREIRRLVRQQCRRRGCFAGARPARRPRPGGRSRDRAQRRDQHRQGGQRLPQRREIARPRRQQGDAPGDAADVGGAARARRPAHAARRHRPAAPRRRRAVPPPRPANAAGGSASAAAADCPPRWHSVEQRQQRRRRIAATGSRRARGCGGWPRRAHQELVVSLDRERAHVRQRRPAACAATYCEQRAGGADRVLGLVDAERRPGPACRSARVSARVAAAASNCHGGSARTGAAPRERRRRRAVGDEQLGEIEPVERRRRRRQPAPRPA